MTPSGRRSEADFYADIEKYKLETELGFVLLHYHQLHAHGDDLNTVTDFSPGKDLIFALMNLEGDDLDLDYADKTLKFLYQLWSRPVHLETIVDGKSTVLTYEGQRGRAEAVRRQC